MRKLRHCVLFLFILSVLFLFSISICSADESIVSITPSQQIVSPGDSFSFNVTCNPGDPVKSYEFKLQFDPSLMSISSVSEGLFFNGFTTFFNDGDIDNTNGKLTNVYNLILGSGNVTSEHSLITVSCVAKGSIGQLPIQLYDVGVTDEEGYLQVTTMNGIVSVQDEILLYNANPANNSENVDTGLNSISIDIEHLTGDAFNYSISTTPDVGSSSGSFQSNGTKSCSISSLAYDSTYEFTVCVQEISSGQWTNQSYVFYTREMTADDVITISNPDPSNGASTIAVDLSDVSITLTHDQGDVFNYSIVTTPDVGSTSGVLENNGTKTCSLSDLSF
ncbi:MAG: hypothetical protein GF411_05800, partial [Candidatus Lokiarchaeota archaeon]|nr:hypothetical protein [Candidatus Lokiarchaeota archaeon]